MAHFSVFSLLENILLLLVLGLSFLCSLNFSASVGKILKITFNYLVGGVFA